MWRTVPHPVDGLTELVAPGDGARRSAGWSGGYLVVSRVSALVAVPILLHGLGSDLYAVWVLASSLIFAQGLVDLGFSAALVRFVAMGAANGSAQAVRIVIRRVALVYAGLSFLGVLLWILAEPVTRNLPYIDAPQVADATALLRYAAVAFVLVNVTTLLSASLQGLNRVASAYRAQTLGAASFVPLLVLGMAAWGGVDAVGIAAVGTYALQLLLLGPSLWMATRRLPQGDVEAPTLRGMFALGMKWQVSAWADFATFQLPRIAAGISLSSGAVVTIDLALRVGQVVATPLFALLPLVLPRVSAAWAKHGREGVRDFVRPLLYVGTPLCMLAGAIAIPVAAPAIETWTGHTLRGGDSVAASFVVAAVLAHASTGLFSSVLLAIGQVGQVVRYKSLQLAFAVPLVGIGAWLGSEALAFGLGLALLVPAIWFNGRASRAVGVRFALPRWLPLGTIAVMALSTAIILILTPIAPAAVALVAAGAVGLLAAAGLLRGVDPALMQSLLRHRLAPVRTGD